MDAFFDWLSNHELVGFSVLVLLLGILFFWLIFWVLRGDIPPLDDDDEFGEGGNP